MPDDIPISTVPLLHSVDCISVSIVLQDIPTTVFKKPSNVDTYKSSFNVMFCYREYFHYFEK